MSPKPPRPTPAEHETMTRLLPVPAERELPADRHRFLRNHLLHEIRQDTAAAGRRRRHRPWSVYVPLAAGALTVALAAGLMTGPQPTSGRPSSVGGSPTAPVLLDRIAAAAAARPATTVRDDQYVYIASKVASSRGMAGQPMRLETPYLRHSWAPVDGSRPGLVREKGQEFRTGSAAVLGVTVTSSDALGRETTASPEQPRASVNFPTYRFLESLPTDPGVLLKKIYDDTRGTGPGPDQEAFVTIGDLLRGQIAPPEVSAALYRAAAQIPGVTVVEDAVDASGRHGVAVARTHAGERTEWIFDRRTLEFIGERGVLVEDTPRGTSGQITSSTAVLTRAVTDRPGQVPDRTV